MSTDRYTVDQIVAIGGNAWSRNGVERVYLNDWPAMVGLDVNLYNSGNVRSALLDGELISNTKATRLTTAKVYLENGRIVSTLKRVANGVGFDGEVLERRLFEAIARQVPPPE